MKSTLKVCILSFCIISLPSCMRSEEHLNSSNPSYYSYDASQIYPQETYSINTNEDTIINQVSPSVSIPESYHVGQYHSPISFKERDKIWVRSQNPQGYTIELADGEKASQVAQKLYKAPKNDRMAQIKYQRNGKAYYKGLYGSYDSEESAQKVLDTLPPEVKQGAGVKNWGTVQERFIE